MLHSTTVLPLARKYTNQMNQLTMPAQSSYRDKSPSRIPRFRKAAAVMDRGTEKVHQPSRLELLRVEYQKQLLKQKEEKMLQLYEENQRRALDKVSRQSSGTSIRSTPSVREFFHERRKLESKGFFSPPIDQHYKQIRRDVPSSEGYSRKSSANSNISTYSKGSSIYSKASNGYSQGSSAGRDRSNLLKPIVRYQDKEEFPKKPKPNVYGTNSYNTRKTQALARNRNEINPLESGSSSSDNSPPPNLAKFRDHSKLKRNTENVTDFQKWKMEQDLAREERLKRLKHINYDTQRWEKEEEEEEEEVQEEEEKVEEEAEEENQEDTEQAEEEDMTSSKTSDRKISYDPDTDLEIEKRQKELLAKIEQQERELEELRKERLIEEEEQTRKAVEKETNKINKRKIKMQEERKQAELEKEQQLKDEEIELQRREMEEEQKRSEMEEEQKRIEMEERKKRAELEHRKEQQRVKGKNKMNPPYIPPQRETPPSEERSPTPSRYSEIPDSNQHIALYTEAAADETADGVLRLVPCQICGRTFAADRVSKHQMACKNAQKKRKVFDPVKMRTQGTEMQQYAHKRAQRNTPPPKKNNWKAKHESFIQSIRYAKQMAKGDVENIGPPPRLDTSDLVPCPHCGRSFNESTAERHIPRCKQLKTKPIGYRKR